MCRHKQQNSWNEVIDIRIRPLSFPHTSVQAGFPIHSHLNATTIASGQNIDATVLKTRQCFVIV